jgi:hypothetical protein
MLSIDELSVGIPFILKLRDAHDVPFQWAETLRGDAARRWFEIYRSSNWDALRLEASGTFRHRVTEAEAETLRKSRRCVVIKTQQVSANELVSAVLE